MDLERVSLNQQKQKTVHKQDTYSRYTTNPTPARWHWLIALSGCLGQWAWPPLKILKFFLGYYILLSTPPWNKAFTGDTFTSAKFPDVSAGSFKIWNSVIFFQKKPIIIIFFGVSFFIQETYFIKKNHELGVDIGAFVRRRSSCHNPGPRCVAELQVSGCARCCSGGRQFQFICDVIR